jgi:alkyl sulfatase BDS1-like metallo-beta-lactamase superfamily hydrolase
MKKSYLLIALLTLSSCSDSPDDEKREINTVVLKDLIQHTKEFEKRVYSYENGLHIAVGYGIANSIMVEGVGGNIIIDASDSVAEAEEVYSHFKKINSNPITAIIYTHNHGDHTFGAAYYYNLNEEKPMVIAHESTSHYVERIMGILNPIISKRSSRMFGTELPSDAVINVGIGPYLGVSQSPIGYIKPTVTFSDELKINISGIEIELYHAPGETNDQLFAWLPKQRALMPGDNIYRTFPNLYTIRGTPHRDVKSWIRSLDHMRTLEPEYLLPSHTKPLIGSDVMETLTIYRDAIQYVHDQTIRLMNKGYSADEISNLIELPSEVSKSPFVREFYGTIRWSVKSIFNGYLGWFDGNVSNLDPLSSKDYAKRLVTLSGSEEKLFLSLQQAIEAKDMQWALQLSDSLLALNYKNDSTKKLRQEAIQFIGDRATNPNKRNYFLSSANELNDGYQAQPLLPQTSELLGEVSIDMFFDILSVKLNAEKTIGLTQRVCFSFDSGVIKTITLRNGIAEISSKNTNCDIQIRTSEQVFKEALAGVRNPVMSVASGEIDTDGQRTKFLGFLSNFSE